MKTLPFDKDLVAKIRQDYPTPFHLIDERSLRQNARQFHQAFSWVGGFLNFFAVKANPNPHIMKILLSEGMGFDCSSYAELVIAERLGVRGHKIMFTSNDTPAKDFQKASELGAIINLDDISHIPYLEEHVGLPSTLSFRFNPGPERTGNIIIGNPAEAKYGLTREQIFQAYNIAKDKGVKHFGLHTMVVSNELNLQPFLDTAKMIFELVVQIKEKVGVRIEFVNLGGGIGIPYHPDDKPLDIQKLSEGIESLYQKIIVKNGLAPLKIFMENGRMVTGPYGFLVTEAIHFKNIYKQYIGVDACMAHLMRPGMYGAYHHISVLGKENAKADHTYDVVGSLCENNDKFAIDRSLPQINTGDILVIHDAGAHGASMGFNYNGKLRAAELLLKEDGSVQLIRRAETLEDYFATISFP